MSWIKLLNNVLVNTDRIAAIKADLYNHAYYSSSIHVFTMRDTLYVSYEEGKKGYKQAVKDYNKLKKAIDGE
jgi:hypothetical protein